MRFQTKVGQDLCVLGSIPELNKWSTGKLEELKPNMVWTEGHIWQMVAPLKVSVPFFKYKYYLIDKTGADNGCNGWERGIDRIVDFK